MRLFSGLEGSLEKYIEGFFKDKFSSNTKVQPSDIAKKLSKVMREKRKISISHVYVPNEYVVYLHPDDFEGIKPMLPMLADEMADYLEENAAQKKFTIIGRPKIDFTAKDDTDSGQIVIECSFRELPPESIQQKSTGDNDSEMQEKFQDTRQFRPLRDTAPIDLKLQSFATLTVEEGNEAGAKFTLGDYITVLGRRETCDVVLADLSVSRRHVQFERIGGRFWVTDLGSSNGTYVNGLPIDKAELTDGDVISIGKTVLIFKEF